MNHKRINQNEKGEQKMGKTMKRVVAVAGLSLLIGLQSPSSVQAAVNYEACPFCGTRVERFTTDKMISMAYQGLCREHVNCDIFSIYYKEIEVVRCQTAGCQYRETETGKEGYKPAHVKQDGR